MLFDTKGRSGSTTKFVPPRELAVAERFGLCPCPQAGNARIRLNPCLLTSDPGLIHQTLANFFLLPRI